MNPLRWLLRNAPTARDRFEPEGVLWFGMARGTLTRRGYSAPGIHASTDKRLAQWNVALTSERLVIAWGKKDWVDVPWLDPRIHRLEVSVESDKLLVAYDAAALSPDSKGRVELRVKLVEPEAVVAMIDQRRGPPSVGG